MCNHKRVIIVFTILVFASIRGFSQHNIFNVFVGSGAADYCFGGRFLMYVSNIHAWGPEVLYLQVNDNKKYIVVNIVLEAKLYNKLVNQMGIAGYIKRNETSPFGLRLSTGYDISVINKLSILPIFRTDIIFEEKIIVLNTLEVGVRF